MRRILSIYVTVIHKVLYQLPLVFISLGWIQATVISLNSQVPLLWLYTGSTMGLLMTLLIKTGAYYQPIHVKRLAFYFFVSTMVAILCAAGNHIIGNSYQYFPAYLSYARTQNNISHYIFTLSDYLQSNQALAWYELSVIGSTITPAACQGRALLLEALAPWGLEHLIARSGLHIYLIAHTLMPLLSWVSPWHLRNALLLTILMLYGWVTPMSVSCMRALIFFSLPLALKACGLGISSEARVMIAACTVSIIWPTCWLFAGTWLSFFLSLILIYAQK